jgi:hypothetical protein
VRNLVPPPEQLLVSLAFPTREGGESQETAQSSDKLKEGSRRLKVQRTGSFPTQTLDLSEEASSG